MENLDLFAEFFNGSTSVADSVGGVASRKPVPDGVPVLDDPLHDFRKSDGAADSLCRQLESDSLISELIGPCFDSAGLVFSESVQKTIGGNPSSEPDLNQLFSGVTVDYSKFVRDVENSLQKTEKEKGRSVKAEMPDGTYLPNATLQKGVGIRSGNRLYKFSEIQEWDYAEAN